MPGKIKKVYEITLPFAVAGLFAWAGWITSSIYAGDKGLGVAGSERKAICDRLNSVEKNVDSLKQEVKEDMNEIKTEQRKLSEKIEAQGDNQHRNQLEMMKMLMEIKRNTR